MEEEAPIGVISRHGKRQDRRIISASIRKDQLTRIDAASARRQVSRGQIIREAVEYYSDKGRCPEEKEFVRFLLAEASQKGRCVGSAYLTDTQVSRLDDISGHRQISRSQFIREALDMYLDKLEP